MNKKLITLIFLSIIFIGYTSAQDARAILDKASESYAGSGVITVKFSLDAKDLKANQTFSQDGTAYMKGNKFKIELPEAVTWFDGKTQWTYLKNTEEVNITNPTGDELQAISPSVLFSIYKKGFDLKYKGVKNVRGKMVQEIEMTAQDKKTELKKIIVEINKSSGTFSKIVLYDANGMENTLTVTGYKSNQPLGEEVFAFNKKDYPEAEIVDLR